MPIAGIQSTCSTNCLAAVCVVKAKSSHTVSAISMPVTAMPKMRMTESSDFTIQIMIAPASGRNTRTERIGKPICVVANVCSSMMNHTRVVR